MAPAPPPQLAPARGRVRQEQPGIRGFIPSVQQCSTHSSQVSHHPPGRPALPDPCTARHSPEHVPRPRLCCEDANPRLQTPLLDSKFSYKKGIIDSSSPHRPDGQPASPATVSRTFLPVIRRAESSSPASSASKQEAGPAPGTSLDREAQCLMAGALP